MTDENITGAPAPDINSDLGFGAVVARESRRRLLNRDGSFNVRRVGLGPFGAFSPSYWALTTPWPVFLAGVVALFFVTNGLFALAYLACGPGALAGVHGMTSFGRFADEFFFSVQTLGTIGYGTIAPVSFAANIVVTIESLVGLLGFSIVTGSVFARFARPHARIVFSDVAVIAPYRGITALMFRIANRRSNQIVQIKARVMISRRKKGQGTQDREFVMLGLERESVVFFPLAWTVVHPIDESSPLFGVTFEELLAADAEILILLTGFDETYSQTVHARSSYKAAEIVFGARFRSMFQPTSEDGMVSVDMRKIHDVETLG